MNTNIDIKFDSLFPKLDDIVDKVIKQEQLEYELELEEYKKSGLDDFYSKEESYWNEKRQNYIKCEEWITKNSEKISAWEISGPLHYGMSPDQMKTTMIKKFKELEELGLLMRKSDVKKKCQFELHTPKNNLTRMWGSLFLNSNLQNDQNLKAADHYIVIDDSANEIELDVQFNFYPTIINMNRAKVISRKIIGKECAKKFMFSQKLYELKYKDFNDNGNIIVDSNDVAWVVDTEMNGFDMPKMNYKLYDYKIYLKRRFKVLTGIDELKLKISLSDIGLK